MVRPGLLQFGDFADVRSPIMSSMGKADDRRTQKPKVKYRAINAAEQAGKSSSVKTIL